LAALGTRGLAGLRWVDSVIAGPEEAKNLRGKRYPPPDSDLFYCETPFTETIRIGLVGRRLSLM